MVVAGKNDELIVDKIYDSIRRQNYTNYRVIHIDDASNDKTIEKVQKYFQ